MKNRPFYPIMYDALKKIIPDLQCPQLSKKYRPPKRRKYERERKINVR